jgi:hypothetical protein
MGKAFITVLFCVSALIGAVLVFRAHKLSLVYNAWTTGVRERNPGFNPPPTAEARAMNTKIMSWIIRLFGLFLALFSILLLLGNLATN